MIGCGVIARQYLDTAKRLDAIEVVAAADLRPNAPRAATRAWAIANQVKDAAAPGGSANSAAESS